MDNIFNDASNYFKKKNNYYARTHSVVFGPNSMFPRNIFEFIDPQRCSDLTTVFEFQEISLDLSQLFNFSETNVKPISPQIDRNLS